MNKKPMPQAHFMSAFPNKQPWKQGKWPASSLHPESDCHGFGDPPELPNFDFAGYSPQPRPPHRDGDPLKVEVVGNRLRMGPVSIAFHRTLRIPDDGNTYPLPPSLGHFPIRLISDYADKVPESWREHGGVFLPLYQREAMWLSFSGQHWRPNALKVGVGKVNALTGEPWADELSDDPQDYMVVPEQPWLDGINAGNGFIRQFVAMPLGMGYTVEGQLTGEETHGGIQLCLYEPKEGKFPDMPPSGTLGLRGLSFSDGDGGGLIAGAFSNTPLAADGQLSCNTAASDILFGDARRKRRSTKRNLSADQLGGLEMGMAGGGKMSQKIYEDQHGLETWDQDNHARVFVHVVNSQMWKEITGEEAPETPVSAASYTEAGLPWFDLYDEGKSDVKASKKLSKVKSVAKIDADKGIEKQQDDETVDVPDSQVNKLKGPKAATPASNGLDGDW